MITYDERVQEYTLSSGRRFGANMGYVGINPDLEVAEGSDGPIYDRWDWVSGRKWTREEKTEFADHMISLWEKFKAE